MNRPVRPVLPAHIRRVDATMRRADRALDAHDGQGIVENMTAMLGWLTTPRTAAERAEEARYERERLAWNRWVEAQRTAARGRAHDRQVNAIRKAACERCTMTHAGEC